MNRAHKAIVDAAKELGCTFKECKDNLQVFTPKGTPILVLSINRNNIEPGKGTLRRIQRAVAKET